MNKTLFLIVSLMIFCMILVFSGKVVAQEVVSSDEIQKYLAKLESPNFSERAEAVNFFYNYYQNKEIPAEVSQKIQVLFLKELENIKKVNYYANLNSKRIEEKVPPELLYTNSEEFGLYMDDLMDMAARSKNPELLPIFVKMGADRELSYYGEEGLKAVLSYIQSNPTIVGNFNMVLLLRSYLSSEFSPKCYKAKGEYREKIKQILMEVATTDNDVAVRRTAVEALGESGDADVIPFLEKVASSDDLTREIEVPSADKSAPPQKKIIYPVREEAQRQLEKLKKKISGELR